VHVFTNLAVKDLQSFVFRISLKLSKFVGRLTYTCLSDVCLSRTSGL